MLEGMVRSVEWQRVREFVLGAPPHPAALAITGEAGAGKSTLWRAALEAAADDGVRILRSEPSASEADMSFAGLSDLLGGVLPSVAGELPAPQRDALEVALLLRPAGEQPPTAHAVALGVLAVLRACAAADRLLVAIDDVHWLDEASLDVLTFALRRITAPLSVLLAARTTAPADPWTVGAPLPSHNWTDLLDAPTSAQRIELSPLKPGQVQRLLPEKVSPARVRQITE